MASECQNFPYFWGWLRFCKAKHTKVVLYHISRKVTVSVWHGYGHPPYDQTAIRTFILEGCISCLAYYPCMTSINWIIFIIFGKIITEYCFKLPYLILILIKKVNVWHLRNVTLNDSTLLQALWYVLSNTKWGRKVSIASIRINLVYSKAGFMAGRA